MVKICFVRGFNATTPFEWVLDKKNNNYNVINQENLNNKSYYKKN